MTPDLLRGPPVTIPDLLRSAAVLLAAAHRARTGRSVTRAGTWSTQKASGAPDQRHAAPGEPTYAEVSHKHLRCKAFASLPLGGAPMTRAERIEAAILAARAVAATPEARELHRRSAKDGDKFIRGCWTSEDEQRLRGRGEINTPYGPIRIKGDA